VIVPFEIAIVVSYELSIVTTALLQFAIKSKLKGSLWWKIWGGRVDRCKPNFSTIWERHGGAVVYVEEIISICSVIWAQC